MLILALLGVAAAVVVTALGSHGGTSVVAPTPEAVPIETASAPGVALYIHVVGQVASPGLYVLEAGDRAVDAIAAAGGFTDKADPRGLNLARPLSDGEQLVVPAVGEAPSGGGGGGGGAGGGSGGTVNLNAADLAALDTLPGIGPAKAQAILDWREQNGRFATVDDLLDVPGIGASTVDRLRELVTV